LLLHKQNILIAFYAVKRSTNASIILFFEKERWMPNLRQQKKENQVAFDACVNKTPHQLFGLI
jgi:hypothetical protein